MANSIDLLMAGAAARERARHVDPAFVVRVERLLDEQHRYSLLDLLPVLALVLAAVVALPVLSLELGSAGTGLRWLSAPTGLAVEVIPAAVRNFWPWIAGLLVIGLPFWAAEADA